MQLGLDQRNRKKTIVAAALMALALILIAPMLRRYLTPASVAATTPSLSTGTVVANSASLRKPRVTVARNFTVSENDPILHLEWLRSSEKADYEGRGRNIFREEPEPLPTPRAQVVPPMVVVQAPPGPAPTPPPPPINLKFYGYAIQAGQPKKAFFMQDDNPFIGGEGEIIDHRYKIVRIHPTSVEVQDVLTNSTQTLPLTPQGQGQG